MPQDAARQSVSPLDPLQRVRAIAELISGSAARGEAAGRLVPEVVSALRSANLFRLLLPKPYGGEELAPPAFFHVMEALACLDASTAWCVGQLNGCNMSAAYLAPAVAEAIWGHPDSSLSWGPPGQSRADRVDGGWKVNGRWDLASGCRHATVYGMQCPAYDAGGSPARLPGNNTLLTLLAEAREVTLIDNWKVLGLKATSSDSFEVRDLFVPDARAFCRDEPACRTYQAPLYVLPAMLLYATGFSAVALGIARAMLDGFIKLAIEKSPRGTKGALADNPSIQLEVAAGEARIRAARLLMLDAASRIWQDVLRTGALDPALRVDLRLAATHAIHEAKSVVDTAYDAAGSTAIYIERGFERRYRDMHTMTQQLQGRRLHLQPVGAYLMGRAPDLTFA